MTRNFPLFSQPDGAKNPSGISFSSEEVADSKKAKAAGSGPAFRSSFSVLRALLKGPLAMMASAVFFAVMAALIRATQAVNPYMFSLGRFFIGILVCLGLFVLRLDRPRWINWPWLIIRGVVGSLAVVAFYWCIPVIGLAKATVLNYTYVIWAAVLAVPFLGERLRLGQSLAVVTAMAGVALLFEVRSLGASLGELLALLAGLGSGIAVIAITRCRDTDSSANIFWSQSLFGLLAIAWPVAQHWTPLTAAQIGIVVAVGLLAAAGQLLMTFAYKYTGATQGSLLSLVTPVLSGLMGAGIFHEPLHGRFVLGTAFILGACAYLAIYPVPRHTEKHTT